MHIVALIILSFLLFWFLKYLDERATFLQVIFDWENLITGMVMCAIVLAVLYLALRKVFQ